MECVAIGVLRNRSKPEWFVPASRPFTMFFGINDKIHAFQKDLLAICEQVEPCSCNFAESAGFYLAVFKIQDDCLMLACDTKLTNRQIFNLASWVLKCHLPLSETAEKIQELADKDPYIERISKGLQETTQVLHNNLDLLQQRDRDIQQLLEKTEKLQFECVKFRDHAEEMNSCWPDSCTLV